MLFIKPISGVPVTRYKLMQRKGILVQLLVADRGWTTSRVRVFTKSDMEFLYRCRCVSDLKQFKIMAQVLKEGSLAERWTCGCLGPSRP